MYKNILCAVDLSPCSDATFQRAIEVARDAGAKLTLIYVVEHFPESISNALFSPDENDPPEVLERQAIDGLHELAARLGYQEAHYEVLFTKHSAWQEIVRFAEESDIDLIVVGSHGGFGVGALLRSTSDSIVSREPCDVLSVHSQL